MSNLIVRSILGLVFLSAVLAVILFVSAGSTAYWQAWLYLAVWTICTLLVTAYLIKYDQNLLASRTQAGPANETQKTQQVIQSLATVFFIGLFVVPGLDYRFHWSTVPAWLSVVALGMVAFGFFIVFLVFRENTYTSATIEVAKDQTVITSGPYSVVRHPMYAGASLLLLFTPLALGSYIAISFCIPLILTVAVRAIEEEKFLRANLDGYAAYCRKVAHRMVPLVW